METSNSTIGFAEANSFIQSIIKSEALFGSDQPSPSHWRTELLQKEADAEKALLLVRPDLIGLSRDELYWKSKSITNA